MNITDTIDALYEVSSKGRILIKLFNNDVLSKVNEMPLWESNSIKLDNNRQQTFGCNKWLAKKSKDDSVNFATGSNIMNAEIKACLLLQHQIGFVIGEYGSGWNTCAQNARLLNRFAKYLFSRGINSLRELDTWPELWIRNIIRNFVADSSIDGGLNYPNSSSTRVAFEKAILVAVNYGLITSSVIPSLVKEALDASESGFVKSVLSHSIIPNDYLKTLIMKTGENIREAELVISEWEHANKELIDKINEKNYGGKKKPPSKLVTDVIGLKKKNPTRKTPSKMNLLYERLLKLNEPFKELRLSVITQLLLFSGMRVNEAEAAKIDCAYKENQNGSVRYYARTVLTKTDDGELTLDWVINEDAYNAVRVLSRYVQGMRERALALLNTHGDIIEDASCHNLKKGLEESLLFGVSPIVASVTFTKGILARQDVKPAFNLNKHKIALTKKDVIQLESMECNYRSLVGEKRGLPYKVGDYFNLTAHQFRHTFAWFIIANRLGDLDDIKYQFKHLASAMTMVYGNRGYESIEELFNLTESFDDMMSTRLAEEMIELAKEGKLAGGGGRRLINGVESLNLEITTLPSDDNAPVSQRQIHFKSMSEFEQFMKKHFKGTRGLPHGICTRGSECKIKNSPDPSGCVFCPTYVASKRHLPAWEVIERRFTQQLRFYDSMPPEKKCEYEAMASSWKDERDAARFIISQIKGVHQRGEA